MRKIHLANEKKRDAEIGFASNKAKSAASYVLKSGKAYSNVRLLKGTFATEMAALEKAHTDVAAALEPVVEHQRGRQLQGEGGGVPRFRGGCGIPPEAPARGAQPLVDGAPAGRLEALREARGQSGERCHEGRLQALRHGAFRPSGRLHEGNRPGLHCRDGGVRIRGRRRVKRSLRSTRREARQGRMRGKREERQEPIILPFHAGGCRQRRRHDKRNMNTAALGKTENRAFHSNHQQEE